MITFDQLTEIPDQSNLPLIDRPEFVPVTDWEKQWCEDGVLILPGLIPDELIARYSALREKLGKVGGWKCDCPYLYYEEIRQICLYSPLTQAMEMIMREPMGLHLNLTGWVTTERTWHQDDYLNPDFLMAHYLAVWFALDDIHPDSGPFEYIPGSHRWPLLRREKVMQFLPPNSMANPNWPNDAEDFVTPACEEEIAKRGIAKKQFLGKKGDVLIWHGRLLHQGAKAKVPGMQRKALIAHYSALSKRHDMPKRKLHTNAATATHGYYFDLNVPLPADERITV